MNHEVSTLAEIIWEYHLMHHTLRPADIIFVLGSHDTRVAERGAELYLQGLGNYIVCSGGYGRLTKGTFQRAEAEIFAEKITELGVPQDKILTEATSTNTSENILFTHELLKSKGFDVGSLIAVQKPYMERRTFATLMKQWPKPQPTMMVTSPQLSFEQYCTHDYPARTVITIMLGDLQRIIEYPRLGFQIAQDVPPNVLAAFHRLCELGYTDHLIR